MATVSVSGVVEAPAQEVWELLRDFSSIDRYASGISSCVMEGHDVGAVRTLTVSNGVICEQLLKIDQSAQAVTFAVISSPLPMSSCISTICVESLSPDSCEVTWSSVFEPKRIPAKSARKILSSVYQSGIEGMQRAVEEAGQGARQPRLGRSRDCASQPLGQGG